MKNTLILLFVLFVGVVAINAQRSRPGTVSDYKFSKPSEFVRGEEVVSGEVFVKFKLGTTDEYIGRIFKKLNVVNAGLLPSTGTYTITSETLSTAQLLDELTTLKEVEFVAPNYKIKVNATPFDQYFSRLWHHSNTGQVIRNQEGNVGHDIRSTLAWNITTGTQTIAVGIIDSGMWYLHEDLAANVWSAPANYTVQINNQSVSCEVGTHGINIQNLTCDPLEISNFTHGTHVSGIIGASGNNGIGVTGVNWRTKIIPIKVLDANGDGDDFHARWGIEYALQLKQLFGSQANIRVLNNSYGRNGDPNPDMLAAINRAASEDILFVAAAGNGGADRIGDDNDQIPTYPANYQAPNVIAVSSIDNRGLLDPGSNYGDETVHLGAPGINVYSTFGSQGYEYLGPPTLGATSMAAPQVSGAALLILSSCNVDTITLKNLILNNTDPTLSLSERTRTGGRLNVYRALLACSPEPSPGAYSVRFFQSDPIYTGLVDINDNGQLLGFNVGPGIPGTSPFIYDIASSFNILPPLPNSEIADLQALNKFGWATGNFLYTPQNGMQLLDGLPGYEEPRGLGINDVGQIVGEMYQPEFGYVSFLRNPNGQLSLIQPYGEATGQAKDINNSGQVVGTADPEGIRRGFIFDTNNGDTTDIPIPEGYDPSTIEVNAINDFGVVVGSISPSNTSTTVGFMYTPMHGTTVISSASLSSELLDVNNAGQAVGSTYQGPFQARAVIYDSINGLRYLDSMISVGGPSRAYDINNRGQIVVQFGFACPPPCIPDFPPREALLSPSLPTGTGSNLTVQAGSVAVTYTSVTAGGQTVVEPIPLPSTSLLPTNYTLTESSLAYNVDTSASFTGSNRVCFNLTSIQNEPTFNRMKLLHFESGAYVDRTSSRDFSTLEICATVTSFSPFVAALAPIAPTAANASISGRILSAGLLGVPHANVQIIGEGFVRSARSSSFGYFRFDDVPVGRTYILEVRHKQYSFAPQLINLADDVSGLEVVADK